MQVKITFRIVLVSCVLFLFFSCKNATLKPDENDKVEKFTITYKVYGDDGWEVMSNDRVDNDGEFDSTKVPDDAKIDYSGRKYSFAGWTAKDLSSANPSNATGALYSGAVVADMTVYAVYAHTDAQVTYKYWNGTEWAQLGEVQKVDINSVFDSSKKPGNAVMDYSGGHYKFKGWTRADNSEKNPSNVAGDVYSSSVTADMTVYAVYSPVYKVIYKYWSGTGWSQLGDAVHVEPNSAFDDSKSPAFDVIKCNMESTVTTGKYYDYAFQFNKDGGVNHWANTGWTSSDEATKTANDTVPATALSASDKVTSDMTVYAMYKPIKDFVYVEKGKAPKTASPSSDSGYLSIGYDFLICDHEVTQAEYNRYDSSHVAYFSSAGDGKDRVSGSTDNLPVEKVSWYDAVEYCNWLSGQEGLEPYYTIDKTIDPGDIIYPSDTWTWLVAINENANGYRLPLEWEWEYAARGGIKGSGYECSGGYVYDVAWGDWNSDSKPHDVRGKKPNELGIFDMSGNVEEWCWDWYSSSGMTLGGAASGSYRVSRGGSWCDGADNCEISRGRRAINPDNSYGCVGFRVVRSCQ